MNVLTGLAIVVALLSAVLIMVEKHAPNQPSSLNREDLPKHLKDWYNRGNIYKVNGRNMFAIKEGQITVYQVMLQTGSHKSIHYFDWNLIE